MAVQGTKKSYRNTNYTDDAALAATGDITQWIKANRGAVRATFAGTWVGTVRVLARRAGTADAGSPIAEFTDVTIANAGKAVSIPTPAPDLEYAQEFTARTSGTVTATLFGDASTQSDY